MSDENVLIQATASQESDDSRNAPSKARAKPKRGVKRSQSLKDIADSPQKSPQRSVNDDASSQLSTNLLDGTQVAESLMENNTTLYSRPAAATGRRTTSNSLSSSSSRSQLFPEETDSSMIASATLMGHCDTASTSTSTNNNNNSEMPKATMAGGGKKTSSLFGAVMKNVQELSSALALHSTPKQSKYQYAASPGGFQLLDFVNAVNSPFHFASAGGDTSNSPQLSTASTPRRDVEWHETFVNRRNQVGWMDWSLKKSLSFECQPNLRLVSHEEHAPQQGLQQFLSGFDSRATKQAATRMRKDEPGAATSSATNWEAGLLYWQHPAVYPLPASLEPTWNRISQFAPPLPAMVGGSAQNGSDSLPAAATNKDKSQLEAPLLLPKATNNATFDLAQASIMPPPKTTMLQPASRRNSGGMMESATVAANDSKIFMERRKREWQEAFGSLYNKWIQHVRRLADEWQDEELGGGWNEVADTYFYASGKGHTILFRAGANLVEQGSGPAETQLVPEILISSSTRQVREKLRSMGVKLFLLEGWEDAEGEFHEGVIHPSQTQAGEQLGVDASPALKAELAALRRAQVFGHTVGPDVSVTTKRRSGPRSRPPKSIPPLVVSGEDDCSAFFEIYLNTLGQIGAGTPQAWHASDLSQDIPRLLCRKVGPFLHSSMQSLDLRKKQSVSLADNDQTANDKQISTELRGILLPCAVRDLVGAAVGSMIADESQMDEHRDNSPKDKTNAENHLVVRAGTFEGDEAPAIQGTIGSHSSVWFNGKTDMWGQIQGGYEDSKAVQGCLYGEVLMMAVWDGSRPSALAYKLDYIAATLLG